MELRPGHGDSKEFQAKLIENLKSSVQQVAKEEEYPEEAVPRMFIVCFYSEGHVYSYVYMTCRDSFTCYKCIHVGT